MVMDLSMNRGWAAIVLRAFGAFASAALTRVRDICSQHLSGRYQAPAQAPAPAPAQAPAQSPANQAPRREQRRSLATVDGLKGVDFGENMHLTTYFWDVWRACASTEVLPCVQITISLTGFRNLAHQPGLELKFFPPTFFDCMPGPPSRGCGTLRRRLGRLTKTPTIIRRVVGFDHYGFP